MPSDKSYTPTCVTLVAALAYNKAKVKTPPSTWQQLLSPAWNGQVGMNDPAQSGPTFPFIAEMMNYLGAARTLLAVIHRGSRRADADLPGNR